MYGLSKSRLMAFRQCPKRLWLLTHQPELIKLNDVSEKSFSIGNQIDEVARTLWPGGIFIDGDNLSQAIEDTKTALQLKKPIFDATFQKGSLLIRADLLIPDKDRYRLIEVKSATQIKDYYFEDVAIQAWVCQQSGVSLSRIEIAYVDKHFIYPGNQNYQGILKYDDVSAHVTDMIENVPAWIETAKKILSKTCPNISPDTHCHIPYKCPFWEYCQSSDLKQTNFPVEILPYGQKLSSSLRKEGYSDLREVPFEKMINPTHQKIWRITKSGIAEIQSEAGNVIRSLEYPRYYLDFETIQFAVPIWKKSSPYEQIPFQWSCHIEEKNKTLNHFFYLSENREDPRSDFVESLINILGNKGSVIVYNATFEKMILNSLANHFPDKAKQIQNIIDRIFDLLPLTRNNYYHPDMKGSWSIKKVLPTIAPDLAYDNLDVADGLMAMDAFYEILDRNTSQKRCIELKEKLIKYCERDTLAMVRIAHYFERN